MPFERPKKDFFERERELYKSIPFGEGLDENQIMSTIRRQDEEQAAAEQQQQQQPMGGPSDAEDILEFMTRNEDKVAQLERESNMEPGSIRKQFEELDRAAKIEADEQEAVDFENASNVNISPEVAAQYAKAAGFDIPASHIPEARQVMSRMTKTRRDTKLDADTKEVSLNQDKNLLNQIVLRSTTQNGRRGVAVTGETSGGRRAEELRGFESEPLARKPTGEETAIGEESIIDPQGREVTRQALSPPGRFFPEPKDTPQRDIEQFLNTLEDETTLLGGAAGQRDVEAQRQRNAIRIAGFKNQMDQRTVLKPGEEIFETGPGEAKRLGGVASLPPRGVGGVGRAQGDELSELTAGAKTQIQKEIRESRGRFQEFANLAKDPRFKPENNLTYYRAGLAKFGSFLDEISPSISGAFNLQDNITDFNEFKALTENMFTSWRRAVTGVAFRPEEEKALRKAFPSTQDGPTAYKAKLNAVQQLNRRIVARLQTYRPGDKIDVLSELARAQSERKIPDDVAAQIFKSVGGNKAMARQRALDMGYTL